MIGTSVMKELMVRYYPTDKIMCKPFKCIITQNGLTHFKNIAVFAAKFLKCV